MFKAFFQCSLSDLAPAISDHASAASARALDPATADRLLPALRNAALTEAVLLRHPLVRPSGLKCDGSAHSKRAWCGMLRDLAGAAGVEASDAALLRVYLVCKECAKSGRVQQPPPTFEYHDRFLGKAVRIPVKCHLQISAPLMLVTPALQFARGRAAAGAAPQQPAPFIGCMQFALFAAQRVRFMFGLTVKACDRASTVDASAIEHFRTASRWKGCILRHVMKGYVGKVQVRWMLCAGARHLFL
jgi:hypothetical protein